VLGVLLAAQQITLKALLAVTVYFQQSLQMVAVVVKKLVVRVVDKEVTQRKVLLLVQQIKVTQVAMVRLMVHTLMRLLVAEALVKQEIPTTPMQTQVLVVMVSQFL
jgi:hypothetical protein